MALFLIVSAPLWFILILSFYRVPSRGIRGIAVPFIGGLLIGAAALSVAWSSLSRTPFGVDFTTLYRWLWIRGVGWPLTLAILVIGTVYLFRPTAFSRIREIAAWISGVMSVHVVWTALQSDPGFDSYRIFLLPFVWFAAAGVAVWLLDRALRLENWPRYVLLGVSLLSPSILSFLPYLYNAGATLAAWIASITIAVGTISLIYIDSRGRLS